MRGMWRGGSTDTDSFAGVEPHAKPDANDQSEPNPTYKPECYPRRVADRGRRTYSKSNAERCTHVQRHHLRWRSGQP